MATVGPVDTDSEPAAETLRSDEPRSDRPWLVSHARKLTISAAAVAVFGAALSLTASSALNVENTSTQAGEPAAERAPLTSASPYPVPRRIGGTPPQRPNRWPPAATGTAGNRSAPRRSSALVPLFPARPFPLRRRPRLRRDADRASPVAPLGAPVSGLRPLRLRRRMLRNLWPRLGAGVGPPPGPVEAPVAWATAWAPAWAPAWTTARAPLAAPPPPAAPLLRRPPRRPRRRRCATSSGVGALGRCRRATSTGSGAGRLGALVRWAALSPR